MHRSALRTSTVLGAAALVFVGLVTPADALEPTANHAAACFDPHDVGAGARGADHGALDHGGLDHAAITPAEQRAIEARARQLLNAKGRARARAAAVGASVPVYVHVMRDASGNGNVTNTQINRQVAELNQDFAGGESSAAANTAFTFSLAGVDRYRNTSWHHDKQSTSYRSKTRLGGKNALNVWLVDFDHLGVATFPWDYAKSPKTDGIRVQYTSLPGGSATNFNLGKTVSHEAGHWFGLYHTFQGGCTSTNDSVADTPAQSSPTAGCPTNRDSCSLPGLDPIHNYMDYSYDSCYNQLTPNQATRMQQMFAVYRV